MHTHRPPSTCPVCSESLITLRLGCPQCGTELSGHFDTCRFCRLGAADLDILEVFLRSRGNIRDVQAHLEVSYPTARARLIEVLDRIGMAEEPVVPATTPDPQASEAPAGPGERPELGAVLADLAAGRIDVEQAEGLLGAG